MDGGLFIRVPKKNGNNASINLEHYGLDKLKDTVSSTGIKVCGESVRPNQEFILEEAVSTKQEENMSLVKIL